VITLSGNLISISSGTLILLGIAGGVSVIARVPVGGSDPKNATPGQTPQWTQLLKNTGATDDTEIDVTRIQMLIFTLISAVFVGVKVAVSYEIPDIPENFLVLMGISNGVYVGGRFTAETKKPSEKQDAG
jgi:hypothetical protein